MSLASRRSSRALIFAAVLAFLLSLHVLYSGSTVPQWKTPTFISSSWSKSEIPAEGERPTGAILGVVYEPGPVATTSSLELTPVPTTASSASTTSTWTPYVTSTATQLTSSMVNSTEKVQSIETPSALPSGRLPYPVAESNKLPESNQLPQSEPDLPCKSLPGAEDVLVVMRTGATEIYDKLTMHLNSTFKCYPNLVIFSDYEEVFEGHQVHDVLKYMDDEIKNTNSDFDHYRHLQQVGRVGLSQSELSGTLSVESGPTGNNENAGWRLDKWKFLPMANMTLALYPNLKWYVFVEPDTYLVWSNLLQWLPKLDPSQPLYFGSEVMIGDDIFAHGGSAFLLSRPALERGAQIYRDKTVDLDQFTAGHWAGDCVLGKALHDAGVELTWTWPMFQGGNPSIMNYMEDKGNDRSLWCSPAMSYHHFTPLEVQDLFHFEQNWLRSKASEMNPSMKAEQQQPIIHHSDVFSSFIMPNLTSNRMDWNNTAGSLVAGSMGASISECRALCESEKNCMQYAVGISGCHLDGEAKLGRPAEGVESGWIVPRVEQWVKKRNRCKGKTGWTEPKE